MDVYQEAEQLRQVPMFSNLDSSRLKLLAFTSESVDYCDGDILCRMHEPSDCVFVIMDGEVEVLAETDVNQFVTILIRKRNELIGEMAVLSNSPRSATLRARGPVRTLRLGNETFIKLLSENPDVALDVMRQLSEKLAQTSDQVAELQTHVTQ